MTASARLILLLLALASACAPRTAGDPAAPPPPPLEVEVQAQVSAREAMPWSAARRLVWTDFRGTAPSGPGSSGSGRVSTRTSP